MIKRDLTAKLLENAKLYPVIAIIGPRQSGKTTLAQSAFPDKKYLSLEDYDAREFANTDPRGFLSEYKHGAVFDEIQRVPKLFSYIQTDVDKNKEKGRFILTGSNHFMLSKNISQSLAGRISILKLLPFSLSELSDSPYKTNNIDN